jgi:hypothetical protein
VQYYAVPLDVLEAAPDLIAWAEKAVRVAEGASMPARRRATKRARVR